MSKKALPKTFEEAMSRLEEITQSMQNNTLPLEMALATYEEGIALVRLCQDKLAKVEQKLMVLDAQGNVKELELEDE